jgi:hypothetical protein
MDFDFISDQNFRASLVNDYRELENCTEAGSLKAVHVLAGSIVEALLIEFLVVSGIRPNGRDPLELDLNGAIQVCVTAGVIQKSTASLCDVIRGYRNLIHPGRMIRLQQHVTREGANIAVNLVSIIAKEVAVKRKTTYGPTAEQIVKKLRLDKHSLSVIPQLLSEANNHERIRLVSSLLPDAYFAETSDFISDEEVLSRFRNAYSQALELLPEDEQKRIAENFAKSVREDSTEKIQSFSDAFFSSDQIRHLSQKDASVVTTYLLSQLEQSSIAITEGFVRTFTGIGVYLPEKEIGRLADLLIKLVMRHPEKSLSEAISFVGQVFDRVDESKQSIMQERIEHWIKTGEKRSYPATAQDRLKQIDGQWVSIPF